ncbi:hypothetical protein CABS01_16719 [Colletotrichum abscissum]|uniref:uncharacterized protein n=1 Tax=Colletotrichum abscissum TaxID=1671311 RepID=UPI0027D6A5F3|nr:uncharacterized protein CABS01_16719 [Colletotrichum abscissum]KAK1515392.1 hypothetical protein CABS01_16719 [Colletotrichum abscissum]
MSSIVPVDDRQCAPYTHIAPEMRMLQQRITDGNGSSSRVLPAESASKALHSTVALKMADRITSSAVVRRQGITETGVQQPAITSQTPHTTSVQLSPLKAPYREINWQLKHQCNTWDRESSSTVRKVKEEDDKGPVDYSDTELEIAEVLSLMRAGNVGSLSKSSHNFNTDPKIQVLPSVEAETSFSVHPPGPRYGHRPVREPHNQARCPSNPPTEGPSGNEMTKPANDSRVPVNGRWSGVESNFLEQEPTKVVQLLCALISDNRPALASSQKQVVRATEPVMKTTSIPSITQLREKLDYGDRNLSRCKALYESARTFPKSFKTSQGWAGSGLRDWEHEEQRNALMEMSQFYLKDRGHGQIFWPDDQKSPRANRLQYSTHGEEIKQTMQQYFWRLNLQRFRSEKYGKNKKNARLVKTGDGNGLSHEYPIDVDALEDRSRDANSAEMPSSPRMPTPDQTSPRDYDSLNQLSTLRQRTRRIGKTQKLKLKKECRARLQGCASKMDTAKYIQRLQNDSDWTKWFNSLRMVAIVHDVWDYIDPDQAVVNTKPQPNYPDEVSLANFSNLLNLEKAKFDIREREYRRVQQSLNDVLKWMISTFDAQHMNQVSRHGNLREMVKSLKENLAPSSQARQELVKRRYTLHLGSIKRQNIMDWLNTYLDIMEEARVLEIISMSDPREQVRDLLRAVKTVAPDWATPEAHQMAKKTLEQPKKGERWHGAIVAGEFRNWIRTEQPDWLEGKAKTTSFATWQGRNEEDKRGGKIDSNWKPECPACPGQKHFAETCHHFNPARRKSTYDPNVNSNKRAIERAQNFLKENPRIQTRIDKFNERTSQKAAHPTSSYLTREGEESDGSISSSFFNEETRIPAASLFSGSPLKSSVWVLLPRTDLLEEARHAEEGLEASWVGD